MNVLAAGCLLGMSIFGAGCGDSAGPPVVAGFPETPYTVVESDQKLLTIEVRTGPAQPPGRGYADVQLIVRDQQGALVNDLQVGVVPWMPAMGHGTNVTPTVKFESDGRYLIKNVTMYMAGRWELRTTFAGAISDTVAPAFDVL